MSKSAILPPKVALGLTRRPEAAGVLSAADWIALALSVVWLLLCAVFFLLIPGGGEAGRGFDGFSFVMTVLAVFMPVALIWVATWAARANRVMRDESARLQAAIDAMRQAYLASNQAQGSAQRPDLDKRIDELVRVQRRMETILTRTMDGASRASTPAPTPPAPKGRAAQAGAAVPPPESESDNAQAALALGTPSEALAVPLSADDVIRALNFPEDENDREGFRALRLALKDRATAGLVRSAQDILTLLAEDGIYMDDLVPDRARPEVWRQFAEGVRGRAVASLGGVRDRSSLALTAGRMRQDPVFRDVAHHFLRKFDTTFAAFEKTANDADIVALSDTRSARAFMLVGRVSGTFD